MGSADFIEDAMDSLQRDSGVHYIMLAAQLGTDTVHRATRVLTLEQLKWFRHAADKMFNDLERDLSE